MRRLRTSGLQFLLALMLSLALWTFVSFTQNPSEVRAVDVPVNVVGPPTGLVVVDPATGIPLEPRLETSVQVTVPQSDVRLVQAENFSATADLTGLSAGEHTVEIEVDAPGGVRLSRYEPSTFRVKLVTQAARTFPVQIEERNRPAFLFDLKPINSPLQQATVTGPEDLLSRVTRVILPVDVAGRSTTFTETVTLEAVDNNEATVPGVTITPERAQVTVPIEPRVNVQRVSVLPKITGQPAPGYTNERGSERIDWNPKYVELIAPFEITGTLQTEEIDLTGRTESFTQTVELADLDPSVTLLTTDTIRVTVPVVPFETPSLGPVFVPVAPKNLGPELQATSQPLGFTVTARGTANQFKQLESNPVEAIVDLRGYGPGIHTLPVTVQLPGGLQVVGELPQVTVTITATVPTPSVPPPTPTPGPGG